MRRAPGLLLRLETGRLVFYGLGIGVLVGLLGTGLVFALEVGTAVFEAVTGVHAPGVPAEGGVMHLVLDDRRWLAVPLLALGLALAGFLGRRVGTQRETFIGDGVDLALEAYHRAQAKIDVRSVAARLLAGIVTLGVGAPLGREGPLGELGAGLGSLFGFWRRLSEEDRRLVFLAGLAAGLGIALRAPIAGAVLAVELIYRRFEFEFEALMPAVLSSVIAYAIFGLTHGVAPMFSLPVLGDQESYILPAFFLLGLVEAFAASVFVLGYRTLVRAWTALPVAPWLRLTIVGLLVGLIAIFVPEIFGSGLGWMQLSLAAFLETPQVAAILFWRTLAVLIVASAGGAGGLITPSLAIGGFIGVLYAKGLELLFGTSVEPAAFALTGAAAFLAVVVNAPLGATLLITEWTGYGLLIPLLLTTGAGYIFTGRESIYANQVESRSASPVHIDAFLREAVQVGGANFNPKVSDLLDLLAQESLVISDEDSERLYRTSAPESWVGHRVAELEWPPETLLVAILRDGHVLVPRGQTQLEPADELIVMAEPASFSRIGKQA